MATRFGKEMGKSYMMWKNGIQVWRFRVVTLTQMSTILPDICFFALARGCEDDGSLVPGSFVLLIQVLTGVSGSLSRHADPPLGGGQGRRVDHKLVGGAIISRGRLQSTQVGRMSQLGLFCGSKKGG